MAKVRNFRPCVYDQAAIFDDLSEKPNGHDWHLWLDCVDMIRKLKKKRRTSHIRLLSHSQVALSGLGVLWAGAQ